MTRANFSRIEFVRNRKNEEVEVLDVIKNRKKFSVSISIE